LVPTDRQLVPSAFGGGSGFQFADEDEPSNIKKRKRQNEDIMDVGGVYAAKLAKHHEEALSLRNDEIRQLREELNQKNALIAELLFDNDKLRRETFKLQEDHDELKEQHSRLAESLQEFATTLAPATIAATAPLAVTQPLGSGPIEGYRDESRTED
jgi:prefoldin subunit 5